MNNSQQPAVFHLTHWKAGSQWVYNILHQLFPERVIQPQTRVSHVREHPLQAGRIYPTVYMDKPEFETYDIPTPHKRFIVIRDLRDTLVSRYFSVLYSHTVANETDDYNPISKGRNRFSNMTQEESFSFLIQRLLPSTADIQLSWLDDRGLMIHYEDMLADEYGSYRRIMDHCQLDVDDETLERVVRQNSFQHVTGRERGEEDISSHHRKGIAGDWKNHFTDTIKAEFKEKYGDLLIKTGYEDDLNW